MLYIHIYRHMLFLMKTHVNNTIYIYMYIYIQYIYIHSLYIYDDDDDDHHHHHHPHHHHHHHHQPSKVNHQGSVPLGPLKQARTWRDLMVLSRYTGMVMTT